VTLVALCSLKGSPGVTTSAVGLAARWPAGEQPLLVECDPAGGDLLARYRLETAPDLVSLAAAARRNNEAGLIWQHTQRLPGGLPVVVGPAGGDQARAALEQLAPAEEGSVLRRAAARAGTVVVADCGRFGSGPAAGLMDVADTAIVLSKAEDDALSHLAAALAMSPDWLRQAAVVLVGEGYPTSEVADVLAVEVVGRLPDDAHGAALLGGASGRRGESGRTALMQALGPLAAAVAERAHHHGVRSGPGRPYGPAGVPAAPGTGRR
jgi:hypothetical protein